MPRQVVLGFLVAVGLCAPACENEDGGFGGAGGTGGTAGDIGVCDEFDPLRQPYFGDTHVHTSLSLDANLQGTRPSPAEAYAFARGQEIGLQPYAEDGTPLRTAQIDRPIDFVMVSDHAEFLGTVSLCESGFRDPGGECDRFRDEQQQQEIFVFLNGFVALTPQNVRYPSLCGTDGTRCIDEGRNVWSDVREAAEAANDATSSCEFVSFVGYEWTANPGARNLHRNIMFRNGIVPELPVGYFDESYVEGLWSRLRSECIDAGTGCDALAIPHNSNVSEGLFFLDQQRDGRPFDAAYAQARIELEPVIEVFQHKGASECLPGDPISDELCGFEILPFSNLANAFLEVLSQADRADFVRSALGEGMKFEEALGVNPFKFGMISSTDTHVAAPGFDNEADFKGHGGAGQSNRTPQELEANYFPDIEYFNPGGLAGVWAEERSRGAIFEAIRRKETFATSGTRIVPRFFGGWDYPSDACSMNLPEIGYADGVPMGGDLPPRPDDAVSPVFIVAARQDPERAPLQRIQIVKGRIDNGEHVVQVHDVAGDPNNGAGVDLNTCERRGEGFSDLCEVWRDDDFDPNERAYYYARVIENPSCRWTTYQCLERDCENPTSTMDEVCCDPAVGLNVQRCEAVDCTDPGSLPPVDARCCVPRVEPAIQERTWTSPIWFTPSP